MFIELLCLLNRFVLIIIFVNCVVVSEISGTVSVRILYFFCSQYLNSNYKNKKDDTIHNNRLNCAFKTIVVLCGNLSGGGRGNNSTDGKGDDIK